ncbi:MAG: quinol monooxygenase YgiN [Hyphomicrobiaceae bacterium]|jgi:quinol monooxygenase YgiN
MLIVAGEVVVEPGQMEAVRQPLEQMMKATRAEPGCLAYAFSVDIADPCVLRVFERWESEAVLAAHFSTLHMGEFGAAMAAVEPKSMDIKVYGVSGELPLPG